jgi:hypothetical protein
VVYNDDAGMGSFFFFLSVQRLLYFMEHSELQTGRLPAHTYRIHRLPRIHPLLTPAIGSHNGYPLNYKEGMPLECIERVGHRSSETPSFAETQSLLNQNPFKHPQSLPPPLNRRFYRTGTSLVSPFGFFPSFSSFLGAGGKGMNSGAPGRY